MDTDNKLNPEVVVPQVVTETTPQINSPESNPKGAGRPPISQNRELQAEYIRIHHFKTLGALHNWQVAEVLHISEGKVKNACKWVRDTFDILTPQEYQVDGEMMIGSMLVECNNNISKLEKGEPVLKADKTPLLDKDGKVVVWVDKKQLRFEKTLRFKYQSVLLDLRVPRAVNQIVGNQTVIQGNVNIDIEQNVAIINKMAPEDKTKFLEILEKYEQPPPDA
ncbi:MAG: hypothetical protein WC208_08385 [Gallionella sp.]|jgi:hypothetical protein